MNDISINPFFTYLLLVLPALLRRIRSSGEGKLINSHIQSLVTKFYEILMG